MKPSSESTTLPVSAATAPLTPEWAQPLWDLTDPRSLRWAASAQMAAQGWAAQLQGLVQCSTSLMIGRTQKPTNLAWVMTIGNQLEDKKHGIYR